MKHETTTLNTKKTIAASLKKFMERKPLSKITVSEIVTDCGINRNTFYYHFEDIQALLKWMLEQEAVEVLKNFDLLLDYEDAINFVLDYVEENKHILNCAYDSMGRDELKRFFYNDFCGIMLTIVTRLEEILGLSLSDDFRNFICDFYTEALTAKLIEVMRSKQPYDREKLIRFISITFQASLPEVIKRACKEE
ncbi:TetR/AcrR family transcriptional regulator C-terminal domain-containing protein [Ruminococcus sp.]|uniref:TetR/AcrR family transcriptional regulator C-terminal domain-containing protein n=2 Tax=Ruminococcus TaxID=1263 RepID=UPI0025EBF3BA|nr:TetR/AcrR family transcriptional regulator C-terminal domain-containing protein [Ruminococcus sp.]MCI5816781.1 TetR/AcrR family transcriptional regulator [Ruminococcus sp.]MDD7555433.1 TetR/AcrR family transcriptional regulator C-terminal domain-containing protein [Ruminococcus sp.]